MPPRSRTAARTGPRSRRRLPQCLHPVRPDDTPIGVYGPVAYAARPADDLPMTHSVSPYPRRARSALELSTRSNQPTDSATCRASGVDAPMSSHPPDRGRSADQRPTMNQCCVASRRRWRRLAKPRYSKASCGSWSVVRSCARGFRTASMAPRNRARNPSRSSAPLCPLRSPTSI
jgi:hypothetical protein